MDSLASTPGHTDLPPWAAKIVSSPNRCKAHEGNQPCASAATTNQGFCDWHAAVFLRNPDPIHHQSVAQCEYNWVPGRKPGSQFPDWRRCTNAILSPASYCHAHGGAIETSLALPFQHASLAAQHDQLTLPSEEYWQTPVARMHRTRSRGWLAWTQHPVNWANLWVQIPNESLRVGDRIAALSHYLHLAAETNVDADLVLPYLTQRMRQPHLPEWRWNQLGRTIVDHDAMVVSSRKVPHTTIPFTPGWGVHQAWGHASLKAHGRSASYPIYPFDATEGGPVNATFGQICTPIQPRHDVTVDEALDVFETVVRSRGWRILFGIHEPEHGVASFERHGKVAAVYGRPGDRHARLHAAAHTAGHIVLGHGICGSDTHVPEEADAEAWAFLALARLGLLTEPTAEAWRALYHVDLRTGSYQGLRAACINLDWTIN